jgi:hypothetical protein
MPDDLLLAPPATFEAVWLWLGGSLLVAVLAYLVVATLITRSGPSPWTGWISHSARARRECLSEIDSIEAATRAGEISADAAASELSLSLRRFAAKWTGVPYPGLTLKDLKAVGAPEAIVKEVEHLYPGAFSPSGASHDLAAAAQAARAVVTTWKRR